MILHALHCAASAPWSSWLPVTLAIVLTALAYVRGRRRLHRCFPEIAAGSRPWLFLGGLLVVWTVIGSPLSTLDHRLLTFHMLQHLVLMTIAAPLLLLATPGPAFLRGLPIPLRRATVWLLGSNAAFRIARSLTDPIVCWLAGTTVVIAWHVPAAHELSMASPAWHLVQHVTFLIGGILFWWPIVHPRQDSNGSFSPFTPLYLFLATLPCDALSAFLSFCGRSVYPSHQAAHATFGLTALHDQECAGGLMWFWVTIAYLLPAAVIVVRMLSPPDRESGGKSLVNPLKADPTRATSRAGSVLITRSVDEWTSSAPASPHGHA
jgi:putative membrane protein